MPLFEKFQQLAEERRALLSGGADPFNVVVDRVISSTEAMVNGQRTILAGTNNYLGLTFHPDCINAARIALEEEGTGTTGSRMANGTFAGHVALERELADFFQVGSAIVFSTGYLANLGVLSTLAGPDDVILLDTDCHASIYDGCRMGNAEVIRFRHNDASDLEKRLRRLGDRASRALILVEGIYSMLGDRAPLGDIAAIKTKYQAFLVVDEAHSLGVLGENGRGLAEEAGVEKSVDLIVGTFSKSLGATGGFCVSRRPELEMIRYASRPYIFTASPSPSVVASTRAALQILRTHPELRQRLWKSATYLYERLRDMGFTLGPEPSPVVAALVETRERGIGLWSQLMERGVYVNLVLPPAAPNGGCLLRCSVSAGHTDTQLEKICDAFSSFS
ncbi:MAG TPA: aminotransferase class I/II-fold pyridoxal phosphate-dependent enzyme [Nitrospirales bacterium]|nr:aminotransferase class I/II-fold pyridoxal phosphate-dependent enzyme [Nitrospirales bacterium]HIC05089.1 aminotransferase class I/II-fold pyridoxal phosphate-dependent enzyme [Nitrospirales bacterium]HIN33971.1 aminotransferase class I/II-fold pyridoxal phosphate-dependent enzyme [Nitrospirales bacterium]HIO69770.1 aminotransferase class I/II-fold pyridoxal phosphate-dependent enzyme [Nitrospirales bacterium]